ncbi:MAG: hypothetical protein WAM82_02505, partial [Thermoanaerobaculia bacterium]
AFSKDGSRLVAGGRGPNLLLWNLGNTEKSPAPQAILAPGPVTSLAFDPGGDRVAVAIGGEGYAWLWELGDKAPKTLFHDPGGSRVTALAFGPARVATGWQDAAVRVFGLDQDLSLLDTPNGETSVTALAFSPDGKRLAITCGNGKAKIWIAGPGKLLENQDKEVRVLAFSQDGRWLAGGGEEGRVQLWDLANPSGVPVSWQGHPGAAVHSISFANGARELITTGQSVRRWPLDVDKLIQLACEKAGRNLTQEEWNRHAPPGEPFREGTPCGRD